MSSFEGYFSGDISVMKEGNSSFSRPFAMRIRLDTNFLLFNPCLKSCLKTTQLLSLNSQQRTIARANLAKKSLSKNLEQLDLKTEVRHIAGFWGG
ncbi:MAG: hypothetical protein ACM34H_10805 [Deltaproteobacteria bacterium]